MEPSSDMREGDLERGIPLRLQSQRHRLIRRVEEVRHIRGEVILFFQGCNSIADAYRLVGYAVWRPDADAPQTAAEPPLGFHAEDTRGRSLGVVVGVEGSEINPLLELEDRGRRILVPWHREIVVEIDVARGRVVIAPPPGLLDLNS